MSSREEAPSSTNGANSVTHSIPELDVQKLHSLPSEQQDLYLLSFTADIVKHASALDAESISAQQIQLKRELFQVINLSSPAPTRAIRNNLGRCFADIFGKGDRKLLYETVNELLGIISTGKGGKELKAKHAAVHCIGEVFLAAGDSAISLLGLTASSLIRLLKPAQNHAALRSALFKALGKLVRGTKGSVDDSDARDIWKVARGAASGDKAGLVQANACICIERLVQGTSYFDNSGDFESLKSTIWKAMDSSAPAVRHAAASCMAAILLKSHSEDGGKIAAPKVKRLKKPTKRQSMAVGEDGETPPRSESPGLKKSAVKLALSLTDILKQLSMQYIRSSTSNKARAGIAACYIRVFQCLGNKLVEAQYGQIADHLLIDLLGSPGIVHNRYRLLMTRRFVQVALEDVVGRKILGESGQVDAAKMLVNDVLKNFPQVIKERSEPSKHTLVGALSALASLFKSLGSALSSIGDSCRDGLLQVLQHPSYTVQIYTSHCLRAFVLACPQQLLPCLAICMNSVNRELNLLQTPRQSSRKCVGYANGLAAVLSSSSLQPLYGSIEMDSRILNMATDLLKTSSSSELRVSATQIQVAWILIGGLMTLGPNFIKIHLSQLMLLWRNALPKPMTRDNTVQRSHLEVNFLTHVRECALGSILAFLKSNRRLLTTDLSKRIASLLQNTTEFLDGLRITKHTEEIPQRLSPALQLYDLEIMARRRVFQCYAKLVSLSPIGNSEALLQSSILSLAVSSFADPDNYSPSSLGIAIASSAGNFESLWDVGDNYGFGVTGLVRGLDLKGLCGTKDGKTHRHWLTRQGPDASIDQVLLSPVCGSREHDSVALYVDVQDAVEEMPDSPATEVVNAAISLFAIALPLQAPKVQESILEQMATSLSTTSLQRDPARKAAMTVNIAVALLATSKVAVGETRCDPGNLKRSEVERPLQDLLHSFIVHHDQYVRNIASEALGRLCNSSGNNFMTNEINYLIDTVVSNRDPNTRAGCAVALGCIHLQVGGIAAGYHLKTILGIILSLCSDPHPTVHFWALEALSMVADSAGLTFSGYVSSTLGLLAQLWVLDSHNEENASTATSNLELECSTPTVIARCIDSLINVLGPDLQDMSKARDLMLCLVRQFGMEEDALTVVESLRCLEHLSLYASGHIEVVNYITTLQTNLDSPNAQIRDVAIDGLYNLMTKDAEEVMKIADPGLEDDLWLALDDNPGHDRLRNIITDWLGQTILTATDLWVQRCQNILTKVKSKQEEPSQPVTTTTTAMPDLQDEEVAGFANSAGTTKDEAAAAPSYGQDLLRWQVRSFAMNCLSDLLAVVGREILSDANTPAVMALQQRVSDVVRMAFSASTSNVVDLRLWGLRIIEQVLKIFGTASDPDFPETPLLEQYQAQISSALTPAFAADSSPELASEAVNVCAVFIATGIVTDVDRMGRILKLLVTALESFSNDSETAAIGELKGLSSNAHVMVKMAIFSAWAELQVASTEHTYLEAVVKPRIAKLTPLWLSSLQEFARLRFEPDISSNTAQASPSESLEAVYSALIRETLLKFYQDSWLNLVEAIASLIEQDSELAFTALDGKTGEASEVNGIAAKGNNINYRDEPVAFFFVLFGIVFEALVTRPSSNSSAQSQETLEMLSALRKILRPSVAGTAVYQDAVFSETMELLDRLVLTERPNVQAIIVEIARDLCLEHPSAKESHDGGENLSDDVEQLFELTRIIVLVLAAHIPNLTDTKPLSRPQTSDETATLISLSLNALVDAAEVFPSIIQTDLHACILHIFTTIFGTGTCQPTIVPLALPIFKRFIHGLTRTTHAPYNPTTTNQIRATLHALSRILSNAQRHTTDSSLACAKNMLLASTILLSSTTTMPTVLPPREPLITRLLSQMLDCLTDLGVAAVAANCLRSLFLLPSPATNNSIPRYLLPRLLHFVATSTAESDPENVRASVVHALTSFVIMTAGSATTTDAPSARSGRTATLMTLVIPALLARAQKDGKGVYKETAARLLELAGCDQGAFRGVVAGMGKEMRGFMEGVIREGGGGYESRGGGGDGIEGGGGRRGEGPSIELRMDFG